MAVAIAACSSSFHLFATSGASGSSGFGAPRRAWIERRIVRIWRAGDQLPGQESVSKLLRNRYGLRAYKRTLQHIQADTTELVNVRVIDLGKEADFGRCHGVVIGKKEL